MKRLLLIFLLFIIGCQQVSVSLNGIVKGYYAEALTDYSIYDAHIRDDKAYFKWDSMWHSVNTAHDRDTPLKCDFSQFNNWHVHYKETCDHNYYLAVTWNNGQRYCAVDRSMWLATAVGTVVTVSLSSVGDVVCG